MTTGGRRRDAADATAASELVRFDTSLLSDALEIVGTPGAAVGLRALVERPRRIAGRAATVELAPAGVAAPEVHLGCRAIDVASPGEVIVVANGGRLDAAAWGGLLSLAASVRSVAGVVVDGVCRDAEEPWDLDLEVFARGVTPVTARRRVVERSFGEPVSVAGVTVRPGDWVIADATGVVFLPADRLAELLPVARELARREAAMRAALLAGEPASVVLDRGYEALFDDVRPATSSGDVAGKATPHG